MFLAGTLFDEFKLVMPTLTSLRIKLFPFIVSVMLKKRCKDMSLVQRVFSMLLYNNATQKEV